MSEREEEREGGGGGGSEEVCEGGSGVPLAAGPEWSGWAWGRGRRASAPPCWVSGTQSAAPTCDVN